MQSNSQGDAAKKDVAVYIDYENLYISLRSTVRKNPDFDLIMDKCREFGRVTVCRAYADWSEFARVVTSQMFSSGVEPIYVPTRKFYDAKTRSQATKNSVDIHIVIDIIKDVLTSKNIDIFVLVSGDRDFVPLMNQIRSAGKEVYAIGVAGCTSSELAVAVDEMFYYHQLLQSDEELEAEQHDVYAKLARAVEIARARGYRATLGVVKPLMREIVPNFDERRLRNSKGVPFRKFQDFVHEAERNGFVKTSVPPGGGALEVFLATETPSAPPREEADAPKGRAAARQEAGSGDRKGKAEAASDTEGEETTTRKRSRRGSRGGRGRRSRPATEAAEASAVKGDAGAGEEPAARPAQEAADETPDKPKDEAKPDRPSKARTDRSRGPAAPEREPSGTEPDDDDEELSNEDLMSLPAEAMDDLKAMLDTFGGRAPSQRRLIARLKKGASSGELEGNYREGQFLLAVRKALQDGLVEKVSKGFYSGLKWSGESQGDAAAASGSEG